MEGAVYLLVAETLVAKVWYSAEESPLLLLQKFYSELRLAGQEKIRTPQIVEVRNVDGTIVTIEKFLSGSPLQSELSAKVSDVSSRAIRAVCNVLHVMRSVDPPPSLQCMSILGEPTPLWQSAKCWSDAIHSVLVKRVERFRASLQASVDDMDEVMSAVAKFLRSRDSYPMGVIHGDVCGANIMVDKDFLPTSVLDFGFMTMRGDVAFDASISSAVLDMYGPCARRIEERVTKFFQQELGYPRDVLLAYRAVYSLLTSNAYSSNGTDGHFHWCVDMLSRRDVRAALGM